MLNFSINSNNIFSKIFLGASKNLTVRVVIVLYSMMLLWGCSSKIDEIKNSTPPGIPSLTIGEILENHSEFEDPQWKSFQTSQGEDVIEFKAKIKSPMLPILGRFFARSPFSIQFILNKNDDGFEIGYCGYKLELIDPELDDKVKFEKNSKEVILVYGFEGKRKRTPVKLLDLFESKFYGKDILGEIANKNSILAEEVFYNNDLRRIINDKLVNAIDYDYDLNTVKIIREILAEDFSNFSKLIYFYHDNPYSDEVKEKEKYTQSIASASYDYSISPYNDGKINPDDALEILEIVIGAGFCVYRDIDYAIIHGYISNNLDERRAIAKKLLKSWGIDWSEEKEKVLIGCKDIIVPAKHMDRFKALLPKIKRYVPDKG